MERCAEIAFSLRQNAENEHQQAQKTCKELTFSETLSFRIGMFILFITG